MTIVNRECIGSNFDDFLREEGIFEEVEASTIKFLISNMIEQSMSKDHISKAEVARRIGTSRSQLDRLLDPKNMSVTVPTLVRVAGVFGKKVTIAFEDISGSKILA